ASSSTACWAEPVGLIRRFSVPPCLSSVLITHLELFSARADALEPLFSLAPAVGPPVCLPHPEIRFEDLECPLQRDGVVLAHRFGRDFSRPLRERLDQFLMPSGSIARGRPPQQAEPDGGQSVRLLD